jgi:enamine deaminase RidA (YjgF/YER057c/UK114 family)
VDERVAELQETIDRERELLNQRAKTLVALKDDAKDRATQMAYRQYVEVTGEFDQLVLRGDVGLIDVAWQRKEGKTQQIEQVLQERSNQLEELKQSFDEVRE